jgi:hypothetical protein
MRFGQQADFPKHVSNAICELFSKSISVMGFAKNNQTARDGFCVGGRRWMDA